MRPTLVACREAEHGPSLGVSSQKLRPQLRLRSFSLKGAEMYRDRHDIALSLPGWAPLLIDGGVKTPREVMKAPLVASKAAREFSVWLRGLEENRLDFYTDRQLATRYAEFCEVHDLTPSPENLMRDALKKLSGIEREIVDGKDASGKRRRVAHWIVSIPAKRRRAA